MNKLMRIKKYLVLLICILITGGFFRIYQLQNSLTFFGDQGWFYLSARDMLLTGNIPLVGIASSHPWLHQGALWTYMLGALFWLFGFNPFVGAYFSVALGVLGVLGMYMLGSTLFSKRVGFIAATLFATSPLIVATDRIPYHTSPIPLFTMLFIYFLYRWLRGNKLFLPLIIFSLGILYNLEIATSLLGIIVVVTWLYGYVYAENWARGIFSPKIITLSLVAFIFSMLPMLIYDFGHNFPQTLGFIAWLGYKVLLFFGFTPLSQTSNVPFSNVTQFFIGEVRKIIFPYSGIAALGIFIASLIYSFRIYLSARAAQIRKGVSYVNTPGSMIMFLNVLFVLGFFAARTPSSAYMPMMFPGIILLITMWIEGLIVNKSLIARAVGVTGVIFIISLNIYYLLTYNYGFFFRERVNASRYMVREAAGNEYNLKGRGESSQFETFTMNYEYLTWWIGNGPSKKKQDLDFIIIEENGKIKIEKNINGIKTVKTF